MVQRQELDVSRALPLAKPVFFCFPALCATLGRLRKFFFLRMMLLGSRSCSQSSRSASHRSCLKPGGGRELLTSVLWGIRVKVPPILFHCLSPAHGCCPSPFTPNKTRTRRTGKNFHISPFLRSESSSCQVRGQ